MPVDDVDFAEARKELIQVIQQCRNYDEMAKATLEFLDQYYHRYGDIPFPQLYEHVHHVLYGAGP